jgi:DNA-binding CsgD family transcriptional regulator
MAKKLKTMDEISAAEAVELFEHVVDYDEDLGVYRAQYSRFPKDLTAKGFFECFRIYRQVTYEGAGAVLRARATEEKLRGKAYREAWEQVRDELEQIFEEDEKNEMLARPDEELAKLTPAQRKVVDCIRENPTLDREDLADKLSIKLSTYKAHFSAICKALQISRRAELIAKFQTNQLIAGYNDSK